MEKIYSAVDLSFSKREHESDFANVDHVYHERFRSPIVPNRSLFLTVSLAFLKVLRSVLFEDVLKSL